MKRKRSSLRSDWFAGLSRRVRQPLGGLLEEFRALLETARDEKQRALLDLARRETHELLALINEILDVTRLEEGNFHLAREPFDLWDLLEGVQEDLRRDCGRCGAKFEFLQHPETPAVAVGDPGRLRQLLVHLAALGRRYAMPSDILLTAAPARETPDLLVMRFSAYFPRAEEGAVRSRDWIELLANENAAEELLRCDPSADVLRAVLVRRLAAAMGGTLEAAAGSAGLEAWCTVALERHAPEDAEAADLAALRGLRVLIVDEDAARAGRWRAALGEWGCRVKTAASYAGALAAMRRAARGRAVTQAAVIFCRNRGQAAEDFGRATLAVADLRNPALLLVAETGRRGDAARLREIGFAAYLTEPVEPPLLQRALASAATARRPAAIITRHTVREMRFRQLKVGVIDGNPAHRMVMLRLLDNLGCGARERVADDIESLQRDDLVFADLDAARALARRLKGNAKKPAIVGMAAEPPSDAIKRRGPAGLLGITGKPVAAPALRQAIGRYLQEREAAGAEPTPPAAEILALFDGDAAAVHECFDPILTEFAQDLAQLGKEIGAGRHAKARRLAASLKGIADRLGEERLAGLLADLARSAAAARPAIFAEIRLAFAEFRQKIADC